MKKMFYNLLFIQETAAAPFSSKVFSLSQFSTKPLLEIWCKRILLNLLYNYVTCNHYNSINNNILEDSKTLLCSSKFSWARGRISSKFIGIQARALKMFVSPVIERSMPCSLSASLIRVIFHEVVCGSSTPLTGEPTFHRSAPLLNGSLKMAFPFKIVKKNKGRLYSQHIPFWI
jgi:hypothetical protein